MMLLPESILDGSPSLETLYKRFTFEILYKKIDIYDIIAERTAQKNHIDKLVSIAQNLDDMQRLCRAFKAKITYLMRIGDFNGARAICNRSLKLHKAQNDIKGQGYVLTQIGNTHFVQIDYDTALEYYGRALECARTTDDKRNEAYVLNSTGCALSLKTNDYDEAIRLLERAAAIAYNIHDERLYAQIKGNIGVMYEKTKKYDKALECYHTLLEINQKVGDKVTEVVNCGRVSNVLFYQDRFEESLRYCREGIRKSRMLQEYRELSLILTTTGMNYCFLGMLERSELVFKIALRIAEKIDYKVQEYYIHKNLSELYVYKNNLQKARQALISAHDLAEELNTRELSMNIRIASADLHRAEGRYVQALDELKNIDLSVMPQGLYVIRAQCYCALKRYTDALATSSCAVSMAGNAEALCVHAQVLLANEDIEAAQHYAQMAYNMIQKQALNIKNPAYRESFLTRAPYNQDITRLYSALHDE
jgi:tetratricopeptide (TPR) repeat protein